MRKIFLRLIMPAIIGAYFSTAMAQVDKKVLNWYNSSKTGMSTDKAYKLLKKMTPDTIIVAIIDSGIDTEHEDLQGVIWINKGEIPGNGIDDDGNGYIDDIHGWNFLGNSDGEMQGPARLNVTRIYATLRPKYENIDSSSVKDEDQEEYALYLETKEEVETNREKYENYIEQINQLKDQMLSMIPEMIANMMGVEKYTEKSLRKWKTEDAQQAQMKQLGLQILSGELTKEVLEEQIAQIQSMIDHHYNPDYDDRSLIGDDYLDITDVNYGNNNVKGPDSEHGTHVGGIVAALRGNGLGGDGVADNVKLMSLRAVPDGDEFDKDIALAIRYAVDNGAKVINASFGKSYSSLPEAVYEAIMYAQENDVLFVHAAGNSSLDLALHPNFPAVKYDFQEKPFTHLLTIGASTRVHDEQLAARFSNYGKCEVDIFAPGFEIYNAFPENKYKAIAGTSMAAPMVTGTAALLKGYFPSLTMAEVRQIILDSGDYFGDTYQKVPGSEELVMFDNLSKTGKVVNVHAAVKLAKERTEAKAAQ